MEKSALDLHSRISGMFRDARSGCLVNLGRRKYLQPGKSDRPLFRPFHASNFFRPSQNVDLEPGYSLFVLVLFPNSLETSRKVRGLWVRG